MKLDRINKINVIGRNGNLFASRILLITLILSNCLSSKTPRDRVGDDRSKHHAPGKFERRQIIGSTHVAVGELNQIMLGQEDDRRTEIITVTSHEVDQIPR